MKILTSISDDYLEGKSVQTRIKRILNIVFNCCIVSFLYIKIYGTYEWYDYYDYKGILTFILSGKFIIPVTLYFAVDKIIYYVSRTVLNLCNLRLKKWTEPIFEYLLKMEESYRSNMASDTLWGQPFMLQIYMFVKNKMSQKTNESLIEKRKEIMNTLEFEFDLLFRIITITSIFFYSNPMFGGLLFSFILIVSFITSGFIIGFYWFLDITPRLFFQVSQIIEKYHHIEQ